MQQIATFAIPVTQRGDFQRREDNPFYSLLVPDLVRCRCALFIKIAQWMRVTKKTASAMWNDQRVPKIYGGKFPIRLCNEQMLVGDARHWRRKRMPLTSTNSSLYFHYIMQDNRRRRIRLLCILWNSRWHPHTCSCMTCSSHQRNSPTGMWVICVDDHVSGTPMCVSDARVDCNVPLLRRVRPALNVKRCRDSTSCGVFFEFYSWWVVIK